NAAHKRAPKPMRNRNCLLLIVLVLSVSARINAQQSDRKSTRLNSSHTEIYTLSLHDALPIFNAAHKRAPKPMRNRNCLLLIVLVLSVSARINAQQSVDAMIDSDIVSLVSTYKTLHAAPELSHREEKTAAFLAAQLRALGYTVTEGIGKFERPEWHGHGIVAVMKNGPGPTVLLRSDIDALPVEERTELPYA